MGTAIGLHVTSSLIWRHTFLDRSMSIFAGRLDKTIAPLEYLISNSAIAHPRNLILLPAQ
jgi:hypothetical protein